MRFHEVSVGYGCNLAAQFNQSLIKEIFVFIAFRHDSFFSSLRLIFMGNLTFAISQVVFVFLVVCFVPIFFALNDVKKKTV